MKKTMAILMTAGLVALFAAGCGQQPEGNDESLEGYPVSLYYASTLYISEGVDEVNGELMPPVEQRVEAQEGDQYLQALNLLEQPPEDESYTTIISPGTFQDVTVEDGIAYVDVLSDRLGSGSLTETIFVDQVLYTLMQSFEEIEGVQFLVDGQSAESLMGHIEISSPLVIQQEDK